MRGDNKCKNNKIRKAARVISTVFVPPVNLTVMFIYIAFVMLYSVRDIIIVSVTAIVFGLILPISYFLYMRKNNKIVDDDATDKDQRTVPYIIGVLLSVTAGLLLLSFNLSYSIYMIWFIYAFISVLMILINLFWKISAHLIGITIPFGIIFSIYQKSALFFIPLIIIIGMSRLVLKVHSTAQVITGAILGFTAAYVLYKYFVI